MAMKKRKTKRNKKIPFVKPAFIIFFLMVGVTAFIKLFNAFVNRWDGKTQLNILIGQKENYFLLVADPGKESVFVINLPDNLLVEAFGGYGNFKLRNLHGLAKQENKPEIFEKSLEYFLGLPVDYWLDYRDLSFHGQDDQLPKYISGLVRRSVFGKADASVEGRFNMYLLSLFLKNRHLFWQYEDLFELRLVSGDDSGSLVLKKDNWDSWAQSYLSDSGLKKESFSLGIYNTTFEKGLAAETARIFSNSGFWVVKIGNDKSDEKNCRIDLKSKDQLKSSTFKRIEKIIDCPANIVSENEFPDFTDINIYLGDQYLSELKKPA